MSLGLVFACNRWLLLMFVRHYPTLRPVSLKGTTDDYLRVGREFPERLDKPTQPKFRIGDEQCSQ
jgi:hypothetical protein